MKQGTLFFRILTVGVLVVILAYPRLFRSEIHAGHDAHNHRN